MFPDDCVRERERNIMQTFFKEQNLRMTRQRRVILTELKKLKTHPSADEIYELVRRHMPRISLGTVYRNLEILSELGEIQKLEFGGTLKEKHYHIRCVQCNRIDDVEMDVIGNLEDKLSGLTRYSVMGHHLEFLGLCPECMEGAIGEKDEDIDPAYRRAGNF